MTLAVLIIVMLLLAGGLATGGVYLLVGTAWAMIAAGIILAGLAVMLRLGMKPHG